MLMSGPQNHSSRGRGRGWVKGDRPSPHRPDAAVTHRDGAAMEGPAPPLASDARSQGAGTRPSPRLAGKGRARPRKPEQQLYVPRGRRGLGQPVLHRGPGITSASQSEPALSRPQLEPSQVDDVACLEHSPAELAGNVPRRESPHFGGSQSKTRSVHREKRAARCQEEKSSEKPGTGSAKAPGSKRSRPEVQLYVPRGRRQHEEQSESSALKGSRRASSSPYTDGEASLAETIDGSCEREQSSVPDSGWTAEPHNLETEESQGQTFESQIGVPMDSEVNVHKDIANTPLHPSFEQSSALGEYSQEVTSSMEHLSDSVGVPPTLTGISADPSITAQCRLESNAEDSSANVVVPLTLDSMSTESSIREQHQHQCSVEELSHDVEVRKLDRESTEYTSSLEQCESPMKGVSNNVEEVHKPESESTDHPSCLEQYQHENSMQDVVTPSTLQNTSAQDSMVTEHQQRESSVEGLSKSSESAVEPPTVESRSHEHPCSLEQHQQGGETSTMSNVTDEGVVQSALHAISDKTQNTLFSGQCEPPVNMDMGDAGARDACDGHSGLMSVVSDFDHSDSAAAANVVELLADVDAEFLPSRGEPVFQDLALTGCMENREELSETCTQEMSPVSKTERPVEEILGTVSVGETRAGEMCPTLPSCGSVDQTKESQSSISDDQGHNGVDHVAKDSTPVCKDVEGSCVAKDSTPVCKDVQESCVAKDSTPVCQDAEESCVAKGSTPVCQDVEESCVAKDSTPVCQDVEESCVAKDSTPVCQDVEESCVAKDSTPVCQDAEESGVAKDSTPVCQDAEESCVAKDSTPVCLDVEERTHKSVTTERDDCSDISANPEALSQSQAQLDSAKTQQDLPSMSSDLQKKADFNDLLPNDIKSSEKQMADPEVAHAASKPSDSGDGFQAGAAQTSQEDEEEEEDSWDKIFDDNGDCLDPSMIEELTAHVGEVEISKPKKTINYLDYQAKEPDMDMSVYSHVIEISDFPMEFQTRDLMAAFKDYINRGFDLKWVDDTHALGIFSSTIAAQDALQMVHPMMKLRPLTEASKQSRSKARRCQEFLQPYKPRPVTSAVAARRLVTGALGMQPRLSKEQRAEERKVLKEAREKKRQDRKQKEAIWDGNIGKCAMDD